MFGIMFGDIGHGSMVLITGLFLCLSNFGKYTKSIGALIIMMGVFSTFCGIIYNEFFAKPFILFNSCYNLYDFKLKSKNCNYPIGIDWIWA